MRPIPLTLLLALPLEAWAGEPWPTTWTPTGITDPADTAPASTDLLSTTSLLDVAETATTAFFRIRLAGNPLSAGNWDNFAWQILVESDGDTTSQSYDQILYMTSSGTESFVLADNTVSTGLWCDDEPDVTLFSYNTTPGDVVDAVADPAGGGFYLMLQVPLAGGDRPPQRVQRALRRRHLLHAPADQQGLVGELWRHLVHHRGPDRSGR